MMMVDQLRECKWATYRFPFDTVRGSCNTRMRGAAADFQLTHVLYLPTVADNH